MRKNNEFSIGADLKYSNGKTTTEHTGSDKDDGNEDQTGSITHGGKTTTNVGSWNNESGSSGSSTVSNTKSLLQTVTKNVSEKTGPFSADTVNHTLKPEVTVRLKDFLLPIRIRKSIQVLLHIQQKYPKRKPSPIQQAIQDPDIIVGYMREPLMYLA